MTFVIFNKTNKRYYCGMRQKVNPSIHFKKEWSVNIKDAYKYTSVELVNYIVNWKENQIYCIETDRWFKDEVEWTRMWKLKEL